MIKKKNKEIDFCRNILKKVSRSFALTIPLLDEKIKIPVMIIYLQDRLIDSFEDEGELAVPIRKKYMNKVVSLFNPSVTKKKKIIRDIEMQAKYFEGNIKKLVENTNKLKKGFNQLTPRTQQISFKWLSEMNRGMQKYLEKKVDTFMELDEYCYFVAGTVGGFLTELIIEKGSIEKKETKTLEKNFVEAGLFLQKVNIIRDIKLDIINHRKHYWPLKELKITESKIIDKSYEKKALQVLGKMIRNVQRHAPALVNYYKAIPEEWNGYKRFYSINNAMGFSTLELLENNSNIFYLDNKLKINKSEVLRILAGPEDIFLRKAEKVINIF